MIRRFAVMGVAMTWAAPALAAGKATPIVIVSDTRHLTGIGWYLGSLYNDSPLAFTALTLLVMPMTGILFAVVGDLALGLLGIDLTSRGVGGH